MIKVKRMAKVYEIPLDDVDEFPNHPYQVKDDEDMIGLMKSIKVNGVLTPAIVRKKVGDRGYTVLWNDLNGAAGFDMNNAGIVSVIKMID